MTAKLSRQFYDRLGETVANELVDWFNQVDSAYKSDLREMNELSYVRFEAKLEQRIAEVRADMRSLELSLRTDMRSLELTLEKGLREQTKFFFLAWAVLLASNIALWFR